MANISDLDSNVISKILKQVNNSDKLSFLFATGFGKEQVGEAKNIHNELKNYIENQEDLKLVVCEQNLLLYFGVVKKYSQLLYTSEPNNSIFIIETRSVRNFNDYYTELTVHPLIFIDFIKVMLGSLQVITINEEEIEKLFPNNYKPVDEAGDELEGNELVQHIKNIQNECLRILQHHLDNLTDIMQGKKPRASINTSQGGASMKSTKQSVSTRYGPRIVYKGPRGGRYVKVKGEYVTLKSVAAKK